MNIIHFGSVEFTNGKYQKSSGSSDWNVIPIPPEDVPVGQILIKFKNPVKQKYTVLITPEHNISMPLVAANYGKPTPEQFLVHLWETIADRTVVNTNFSFLVIAE